MYCGGNSAKNAIRARVVGAVKEERWGGEVLSQHGRQRIKTRPDPGPVNHRQKRETNIALSAETKR